jgi:hypothetical protein
MRYNINNYHNRFILIVIGIWQRYFRYLTQSYTQKGKTRANVLRRADRRPQWYYNNVTAPLEHFSKIVFTYPTCELIWRYTILYVD